MCVEQESRDLDKVLADIRGLVDAGVLNKSILVVQHGNGEVETFEYVAQPCQHKATSC